MSLDTRGYAPAEYQRALTGIVIPGTYPRKRQRKNPTGSELPFSEEDSIDLGASLEEQSEGEEEQNSSFSVYKEIEEEFSEARDRLDSLIREIGEMSNAGEGGPGPFNGSNPGRSQQTPEKDKDNEVGPEEKSLKKQFSSQMGQSGWPRKKGVPTWSVARHDKLVPFLRECDKLFAELGVTVDAVKIEKMKSWIEAESIDRMQACGVPYMDETADPETANYKEFKNAILKLFPEAQHSQDGSRSALKEIARKHSTIPKGHADKTQQFTMEFMYEAKKLLNAKPNAKISNEEACYLYLEAFAEEVSTAALQEIQRQQMAQVQDGEREADDADLFNLEQFCTIVQRLQTSWSTISRTAFGQFAMAKPKVDLSVLKSQKKTSERSSGSSGQELDRDDGSFVRRTNETEGKVQKVYVGIGQNEEENVRMRTTLDSLPTMIREIGQRLDKFEANPPQQMKRVEPPKVVEAPRPRGVYNVASGRAPPSRPTGNYDNPYCYYCEEPGHKQPDCPKLHKAFELGWIKKNQLGRWVFKDDSLIMSKERTGKSRHEYVLHIVATRGWGDPMQIHFTAVFEEPDEDHLFETQEDYVEVLTQQVNKLDARFEEQTKRSDNVLDKLEAFLAAVPQGK